MTMSQPAPQERPEIIFFDVETTIPTRPGQGYALLEFGAILVCSRRLVELRNYSTLIRPDDPSLISSMSIRCNGITPDSVSSAPSFSDIADEVYNLLHGRIWAGHNILRFDCPRVKEAYEKIGRQAPEPKSTIDSLVLLTQRFGRWRAGNMKMATLATYFGIGKQTHRSLDDVRMNLEVLKYCATVLFLESSLPGLTGNSSVSPIPGTRSHAYGNKPLDGFSSNVVNPSSSSVQPHPIISLLTRTTEEEMSNLTASGSAQQDPFNMGTLGSQVNDAALRQDATMEAVPEPESPELRSTGANIEGCSGFVGFLEPEEVSASSITASLVPMFRGLSRIKLSYNGHALQLFCSHLKIRFGLSTKYLDHNGRPRLSIVVDAPPRLCGVLDGCENLVRQLSAESGSNSEWRPVVTRKDGFFSYPTTRLNIPTVVNGDTAQYATEMHQKDSSGTLQKLVFSRFDVEELNCLFLPGKFIDAFFSVDPYDYQQSTGIRLVAKNLIIHSD